MTPIQAWLAERLTPAERRALAALALAWSVGAAAERHGWPDALAGWADARLRPPLPSPEELALRLPPGDPRPDLLAAGLALRSERQRAASAPEPLDPNTADRAAWDRLPGIGPKTAEAILEHRARRGPLRGPQDLLAVRGIGPVTLERIQPFLRWPDEPRDRAAARDLPDLNAADPALLASVPGIGPKLAKSIVTERRRLGGFRSWTEVLAVKGIGDAKLRVLQNATRLVTPHSGTVTPDPADEGAR